MLPRKEEATGSVNTKWGPKSEVMFDKGNLCQDNGGTAITCVLSIWCSQLGFSPPAFYLNAWTWEIRKRKNNNTTILQGEQYFETMPYRVENPEHTGESCPWPNAFTVCLGEVPETILTTISWIESTFYFPSQKVLPGPEPLSAAPSSFQNEQPHFLFLVFIFHSAFFSSWAGSFHLKW